MAHPTANTGLRALAELAIKSSSSGRVCELVDIGINVRGHADVPRLCRRAAAAGVTRLILTGTSEKGSIAAGKVVDKFMESGDGRDGGLGQGEASEAVGAPVAAAVLVGSAAESTAAATAPPPSSSSSASSSLHGVQLFFTAGVHPHEASTFDDASTVSTLQRLLQNPRCVAVGETGLDYDRMRSPRPAQLHAFEQHVALAVQTGKPMFLHERDVDAHRGQAPLGSHHDLCSILSRFQTQRGLSPARVCIHCFTGSAADLADYVARGFYIGITGFVAMKKRGAALRAALQQQILPLERLLVETDAPYMAPEGLPAGILNGRDNEPCALPRVVQVLAECYGVSAERVATVTTENALRFFGLGAAEGGISSSAGVPASGAAASAASVASASATSVASSSTSPPSRARATAPSLPSSSSSSSSLLLLSLLSSSLFIIIIMLEFF